MSLPKLEVPVYTTELPSTKEKVEYRPFLVKEQKKLLIALNGDLEQQVNAVNELVEECTYQKVSSKTSPAYDIEYLFLQIRAKSVGESIDIILTCNKCEHKQDAKLDITTVKVHKPEAHKSEVDLGNNLLLTMKDPDILELAELREDLNSDNILKFVASSIKTIWKGDEMYDTKDYSKEELLEFVDELSPQHLEKINVFFETLPTLRHELDFKCVKCETENKAVLEGLQSFFV